MLPTPTPRLAPSAPFASYFGLLQQAPPLAPTADGAFVIKGPNGVDASIDALHAFILTAYMRKDLALPTVDPKKDAETVHSALAELGARCRTVFTLFTWEDYTPCQIVSWMAKQGVAVDIDTVMSYLSHASRHVGRRLAEAARRPQFDVPSTVISVTPFEVRQSTVDGSFLG